MGAGVSPLYTTKDRDGFLKNPSANARADVVRVHAAEGEEDLPRVDKRVLNHCRQVERQRNQAVDEAKIDAGQEQKKRTPKIADPYYICKKWLHKGLS